MEKITKNKQNGITLIALIITIIVLLILAGVTIAQIAGNDSAPNKAVEARTKNEQGAEFDAIKLEVVEAIVTGENGLVNKENLVEALRKIPDIVSKSEVDDLEEKGSENGPWTVTGLSGNKYTITKTGQVTTEDDSTASTSVDELNNRIGGAVSYSVTVNGEEIKDWQLFYADEENKEVFIISKNILETGTRISEQNSSYPNGSRDIADGSYGRKYNSIWFSLDGMPGADKTNPYGNVNDNAKTVAYLCDSTNEHWTRYAGGKFGGTIDAPSGTYAVGGPTIELLQKSVKEYDDTKLSGNLTATVEGYNAPFNLLPAPYKAKYNSSSYGSWWLASPSDSNGSGNTRSVRDDGSVLSEYYSTYGDYIGVRPIISVPLSSFKIDWVDTAWQLPLENDIYNLYALDEETKTLNIRSGPSVPDDAVIFIKPYAIINGVKYKTKFPDSCEYLFTGKNMKKFKVDSGVDVSNITSMKNMFTDCRNLVELDLSNFNSSNVTDISSLCQNCASLTKLDLSNFDTGKVSAFNNMIAGCQSLETLDLTGFITEKNTNIESMLTGASNLRIIDVSEWNTSNVTSMQLLFAGLGNLEIIYSDKDFDISSVNKSNGIFGGCSNLVGGNRNIIYWTRK